MQIWILTMRIGSHLHRDLASSPSTHLFKRAIVIWEGQEYDYFGPFYIIFGHFSHFQNNYGWALLFKKTGNFEILAKSLTGHTPLPPFFFFLFFFSFLFFFFFLPVLLKAVLNLSKFVFNFEKKATSMDPNRTLGWFFDSPGCYVSMHTRKIQYVVPYLLKPQLLSSMQQCWLQTWLQQENSFKKAIKCS